MKRQFPERLSREDALLNREKRKRTKNRVKLIVFGIFHVFDKISGIICSLRQELSRDLVRVFKTRFF